MCRLALLSFHGCPVARLGEKDTGGMNVYVLQLARQFGRRGCQVDVYTRRHDPNDPQIVELGDNARVIHLEAGLIDETKEALHEFIPDFLANLEEFRQGEGLTYDLVHSHYWLSGWAGTVLQRRWSVPHLATFHTTALAKMRARSGEQESELRLATERQVMASADCVVVFTEQEMEDLSRLYDAPTHKVEVIPAGVDLDLFRPVEKATARRHLGLTDERVILYVGRIEPLKGLDILIEALCHMDETAGTRALIVGGKVGANGHIDSLEALAADLGVDHMVTFTGAVPQEELPCYYSAADVFVLPSHYESFGLAALEAMACGTPVVASRVGGLTSVVRDGETGYLIPWRCPEPFAQKLDMLLANPALGQALGRTARARAQGMGWSGVADAMLGLYSDVTATEWESIAGG